MTFSEKFIAKQKDNLLREKKLLEGELKIISTKDKKPEGDYDANFPDYGRTMDDNAMEEEEYSARVGVENSLEIKLRDINAALEKIAEHKYGYCVECGELLDEKRLLAMPSAQKCVTHK